VEKYYRDGHIREIAEYCEGDVVNTYRVWLRYELFRGRLPEPSAIDFMFGSLSSQRLLIPNAVLEQRQLACTILETNR